MQRALLENLRAGYQDGLVGRISRPFVETLGFQISSRLVIGILASLLIICWFAANPIRSIAASCQATMLVAGHPEGAPQARPVGTFISKHVSGIVRPERTQVILAADELGRSELQVDDMLTLETFARDQQKINTLTWRFNTPDRQEIIAKSPQDVSDLFPVDETVTIHVIARDLYPPYHSASPLFLVMRPLDVGACRIPHASLAQEDDIPTPSVSLTPIINTVDQAPVATPDTNAGDATRTTVTATPTIASAATSADRGPIAMRTDAPGDRRPGSLAVLLIASLGLIGLLCGSAILHLRPRQPSSGRSILELEVTTDGRTRRITPFSHAGDVHSDPDDPLHELVFVELGLRARKSDNGVLVRPCGGLWDGWNAGSRELTGSEAVILEAGDSIEHVERGVLLRFPADRQPEIFTPDQPHQRSFQAASRLEESGHERFTRDG